MRAVRDEARGADVTALAVRGGIDLSAVERLLREAGERADLAAVEARSAADFDEALRIILIEHALAAGDLVHGSRRRRARRSAAKH